MNGWNRDEASAPKDASIIAAVTNKDGTRQTLKTHWLVIQARWLGLATGQRVDAWQLWPTHPEATS